MLEGHLLIIEGHLLTIKGHLPNSKGNEFLSQPPPGSAAPVAGIDDVQEAPRREEVRRRALEGHHHALGRNMFLFVHVSSSFLFKQ